LVKGPRWAPDTRTDWPNDYLRKLTSTAITVKNCAFCEVRNISYKQAIGTLGYNWDTLFLGEINTGTWSSRLGESQK
jgi:hypothetical protein